MAASAIERNKVSVGGRGAGAIVFGNGFGTDQRAWRLVAPALAALAPGRRTVTFDHAGFGASSPASYDPLRHRTLDGYALDLIDVLDAAGIERAVYVGHSIGGVIGLLAAGLRPERFDRLVLLGSSPRFVNEPGYVGGFEHDDIEGILDAMERDQLAWARSLAPVAMGTQSARESVHEFENGLNALDPLVARSFGRLVFHVDARDRLAAVRTPVLIVQCTQDSIVPREVGAYLQRHLAGSTLREIAGSGHCPHLTHPRETVALISEYLGAMRD